jgi:hypothetical protein
MAAQVEEVVASAEELSALAEQLRSATAQFRVNGVSRNEREQWDKSPQMAGVPVSQPQMEPVPVLIDQQGNGSENQR